MNNVSARLVKAAIDVFGGDPVHTHDGSAAQAVAAVLRELADVISEHFDELNNEGYPEDFELPTASDLRFIALDAERGN